MIGRFPKPQFGSLYKVVEHFPSWGEPEIGTIIQVFDATKPPLRSLDTCLAWMYVTNKPPGHRGYEFNSADRWTEPFYNMVICERHFVVETS